MPDTPPDPQAREKRGRFEIRLVFVVVAAVIVAGAIWALLFGSPGVENEGRDDVAALPGLAAPPSSAAP